MIEGFFKKLFGKQKSKDAAKKRLKLALVYDKLEVSDDLISKLQQDIVDVISRYFVIDKEAIKLDIRRSDDYSSLTLNTPILSARRSQSA
ncbi:MAG: cell division topological specificity factor MinE [Desulfobacterales bacterium]